MLVRFGRRESVDQLIARGNHRKAVALLRGELKSNRRSVHLRQKLADSLVKIGEEDEAVEILQQLVDEFADGGFWAKAIAVLKKMQRVKPDWPEVEKKLAAVIASREKEEQVVVSRVSTRIGTRLAAGPAAVAEPAGPIPAPAGSPFTEAEATLLANESLIFEIDPTMLESSEPPTVEDVKSLQGSLLFRGLSEEEVAALIRGLNLRTFEPGEIIVTENEPGSSMYLIASGAARVYVKNAKGYNIALREMKIGEFFGEISLLTRRNRTTTITAADRCELLELDRDDLRAVSEQYPHLLAIVEELCIRRTDSDEERQARQTSGEVGRFTGE
jgi:hypothetical protein